ncbi:MAG: hypothetical protein KF816_11345 [Melioribacteraceae bacterium]|nr:hypothetical protein [Melioribacteraceae bacterium]
MIEKEYKEQVLDQESTHVQIKHPIENENIVVCDLVIKEGEDVKQVLATDRYYELPFVLTEQEIEALKCF